ncbi:MAG TPA: hypothetical protein VMW63_06040 [Methanoregulaceae archaeon]|nr:hypothetical protein [Methanoregulaceae archaeon]
MADISIQGKKYPELPCMHTYILKGWPGESFIFPKKFRSGAASTIVLNQDRSCMGGYLNLDIRPQDRISIGEWKKILSPDTCSFAKNNLNKMLASI